MRNQTPFDYPLVVSSFNFKFLIIRVDDLSIDRETVIDDMTERIASNYYAMNGTQRRDQDVVASPPDCQNDVLNSIYIYFPSMLPQLMEEKKYDCSPMLKTIILRRLPEVGLEECKVKLPAIDIPIEYYQHLTNSDERIDSSHSSEPIPLLDIRLYVISYSFLTSIVKIYNSTNDSLFQPQ